MRVLATARHDGGLQAGWWPAWPHIYTPSPLCVCVPPRPLPRQLHYHQQQQSRLHAPSLSGRDGVRRVACIQGSILVAREGWAGTRQANSNWGCLSEPQPKSALCARPKLWREGEVERTWWHTDVARIPRKRGKGPTREPQLALGIQFVGFVRTTAGHLQCRRNCLPVGQ
jgi:hypothetical protein